MRDAKRIDRVLKELGEAWKDNPDLRLGQLLLNIARDPALYYIEDEDLIERVKAFYGK